MSAHWNTRTQHWSHTPVESSHTPAHAQIGLTNSLFAFCRCSSNSSRPANVHSSRPAESLAKHWSSPLTSYRPPTRSASLPCLCFPMQILALPCSSNMSVTAPHKTACTATACKPAQLARPDHLQTTCRPCTRAHVPTYEIHKFFVDTCCKF